VRAGTALAGSKGGKAVGEPKSIERRRKNGVLATRKAGNLSRRQGVGPELLAPRPPS